MMKNQFFVGIGYNYLIARCVDEVYEIFFYSFIQFFIICGFYRKKTIVTADCYLYFYLGAL